MSIKGKSILFLAGLFLSTLACGLENIQYVESPDLEATITAQAALLQPAAVQDPAQQVIVVVTATSEGGSAPAGQPVNPSASTATPTGSSSGGVTVVVSVATNCRTGPGQAYPSIYGLPVGTSVKVVGKNPSVPNYWVIEIPGGSGGTCWLWGQYATVTGDTSGLKVFSVPATPTPTNTPKPTATLTPVSAVPNAPAFTNTSLSCTNNPDGTVTYNLSLTWQDNSTNEVAFVVNTNTGSRPLPPNTTSFSESYTGLPGATIQVSVLAGGAGGVISAPASASLVCP